MSDELTARRNLLLLPLLAALPMALANTAEAEKLNSDQTIILPRDKIEWKTRSTWPKNSVATADLYGSLTGNGIYLMLIKWYPGYMSAPHSYVTDRLSMVISGTWWVNSGADFDPANCVPVPAGSFVHRKAHTPHYDGVIASGTEPVVIALCGMGPVGMKYMEPDKPGWRKV